MKIYAVQNQITFESKKAFKRMFKVCAYSGENFMPGNTKTIEHIVPLSRGGSNDLSNKIVVRRDWNMKRSSTPLSEFIKKYPQVEENLKNTINLLEGVIIDGIEWAKEVKSNLIKELGRDIFKN